MSQMLAQQVLDALAAGDSNAINESLGRLYNKGKSPEINIPRGTKAPQVQAPEYAMGPEDCEYNKLAVSHVGPKTHFPELNDSYDLVVIGAGVAGLLSVIVAKSLGKKSLLIEKHYMGGDCLNVGCFPSKALIACARKAHELKHSAEFGISCGDVEVDFPFIMERMRKLRAGVAPHDGVDRYARDFCEHTCIGTASFASPTEVTVTASDGRTQTVTFGKCMVATGASAAIVPVPGLRDTPHLTNGNFFNLTELPPRACLIGAGPIGIEMAQSLQRFGCRVTIFEVMPQLLPREDPDAAKLVTAALLADGVDVHYAVKIVKVSNVGSALSYTAPWPTYSVETVLSDGTKRTFECEALLNATGRSPNVSGIGLEAAGIEFDTRTGVHIDDEYRTTAPNVYSCGDVASPYKFTHAADWQARCAVRNMFLDAKAKHSDLLVPWCTYTDPEVAHVGLYEKEMDASGTQYDTYVRQLADVDRCKCEGVTAGFVKISCARGTDEILGSTIVGPEAGSLISEITVCMQNGIGLKDIAGVMHPYPTTAEAIRQCAAQFWFSPHFAAAKVPAKQKAVDDRIKAVAN